MLSGSHLENVIDLCDFEIMLNYADRPLWIATDTKIFTISA
jgi:hypothetical protein